jgi:glyoxylase-like metal-dependent hydrolase (beta-lactamase superfamily II)
MLRWALAVAVAAFAAPQVAAAPTIPGVVLQPPAVYSFTIGEAKVTALSDGTMPMDLHRMLQGIAPAEIDRLLGEAFLANPVQPPINCYAIQLGGRTILVDAGMGDLFGPGNGGRLAEALEIAGIRPEAVNDILLTHLHPDHVGHLAVAGRMAFPNAVVHAGKPDIDLSLATEQSADPFASKVAAVLKPYRDAGRLRPFDRNGEIVPGITAELRPGHSPGSAIFRLVSGGQELVIIGDIVHVAQIQLPRPEVTFRLDHDPAMARADREDALRRFAAGRTLIASPHINFPGVGHVVPAGRGYRWVPIEYGNRDPNLPAPKF